ncbi:MAG: hypothetical protein P0Y65_14665 [Candidatus Devosia phytovorans]|uniref:DUF1311 domain-containing protein n=1 Tax=Candidatus Devosia phytovorans TaxID=3121372 RepID=A0AAJ5VSP7_9HYPH|nr:hypothetical protein [Devosia sp.]WEK03430.1 MAG: hypothetical protein P0Y65_14665 [Devosia sp.]
MARLSLALSLCALMASPALADDAADFTDALGQAATGVIIAEAYMAACEAHYPETGPARRDALAGWAHRVDVAGYHRLLEAAMARLPDLEAEMEDNRQRAQALVDEDVAKDGATCGDLRSALSDNAMFDIEQPIRYLLRNAEDFGIVVAEAEVGVTSDEIEVVPLVMLSAQLASKMDEIGSKAGAQEDRDLREAREDHAEAWLAQRPAIVIFGRVTDEDSLREWRGDQQSAFLATCQSFADDDHEARMAQDIGEDRIIVGGIRWLRDDREGGVVSLDDCRIFVHDPAEAELASLDDEAAGLMLRPPEYGEAFAGPEQGIPMGDIDRVLYDAEFNNRMDGFGNGYTQRDEDIYVLLRDGTAYRHEWNFAFTDLDVDLSRLREPDRWFTWRDDGGTVTLTQTGGLDTGSEIDISNARLLMPAPAGLMLDQTYYYLNVGMGGSRSDRDYAFSGDGQLHYSRSGFVAGNFGTSYIIVAGDTNDEDTRAGYRLDGYTLLIDGPDGEERHFLALIEGQDPHRPEEIIIDGQVHWLREDD